MKKKQDSSIVFLSVFLSISIIFLCIGYAANGSITGEIKGEVIAKKQDGIYITNVVYDSNMNADPNLSSINSYYQTTLNSTINLSTNSDEGNSAITYLVTIYNSTSDVYRFNGVKFGDDFYDNENIIYELTNLNIGDKLVSKGYVTFYLTFSYLNDTVVDNNELNSYLNFDFINVGNSLNEDFEIVYTLDTIWDDGTTYYYQANFTVTNVGDVPVKNFDLDITLPTDCKYQDGWSDSGLVTYDSKNLPILSVGYPRAVDVSESIVFSFQFGVKDDDFSFIEDLFLISGTRVEDDANGGVSSGGSSGGESGDVPGGEVNPNIPVSTPGIEVDFVLPNAPWYDGEKQLQVCQWGITVKNTTDEIIEDWQVVIKLTEGNSIGTGWNLQITEGEGYAVIKGVTYNSTIYSGSSISDGFIIYTDGICVQPVLIK